MMAHILLIALEENERLKRELAINRRILRARSEPLKLPDEEFRKNFRLTRVQFSRLCDEIVPLMAQRTRLSAVAADLKVRICLASFTPVFIELKKRLKKVLISANPV